MRVLVLDKNKQPLIRCHPVPERESLAKAKAVVFQQAPFTLISLEREVGKKQGHSWGCFAGRATGDSRKTLLPLLRSG